MKKLLKSNRGMTLIEVIVSLAVLGIVSLPLLTLFTNGAVIIKKTDERLKVNAVTRIVKENVINSVKYGGNNKIFYYNDTSSYLVLKDDKTGYGLQVKGEDGTVYDEYMFDAERVKDFGVIAGCDDTCEYLITLEKKDGSEIQKLRIYINSLDP